ncbi:hypothetical protein LUZ60_004791 [Juncus effusus]|nr:hypothetical protein LUZ60_004791 [Juncus effusus]
MPTLRSASKSVESPKIVKKTKSEATPPSKKRSSDGSSPAKSESDEGFNKVAKCEMMCSPKSARKRLYVDQPTIERPKWNPKDPAQMKAVKEALHIGTIPSSVACREEEQNKIFDFCRGLIEKERAGSLYVCGCPGTGKTLSMGKIKTKLTTWSKEMGFEEPDALSINCTSLSNTSEIFNKILENFPCQKKTRNNVSLVIVDEMDYLITKDRSVLHDLFMLTTFPFSNCILIGIANAIDLAHRFLPKLESLNCKPLVITFRAYSKDQISEIIQQRLKVLGYDVFDPLALNLCAMKVSAATGDMRKALGLCRSAVELLETEIRDSSQHTAFYMVTSYHMHSALNKAFEPKVVDTILSLPQQQQIILCALVNQFGSRKKGCTIGELSKAYVEICKSSQIPAVGIIEFTNLCRGLSDQGLLKLGNSKDDKLRRVTSCIDARDINFAFKGNRFFENCMQK